MKEIVLKGIDLSTPESRLEAELILATTRYERDPSLKNAILLHMTRLQGSTDQSEIQVREFLEKEIKRRHNLDSRERATTLDGGVLSDTEEERIYLLLKMREWLAKRKAKNLTPTVKDAATAVRKETGTTISVKTLQNWYNKWYPIYSKYFPPS